MLTTAFALAALLWLPGETSALALSHWDLETANLTCDGKAVCAVEGRGSRSRLDQLEVNWRDRSCMCDPACAQYGDCCLDARHFDAAQQRRGAADFHCEPLRQFGGVYMRRSCPPHWTRTDVRNRCEGEGEPGADPLSSLPVTSRRTGVTYRNAHCALCHGDLHPDAELWRPRIECPGLLQQHDSDQGVLLAGLSFDASTRHWGLNVTGLGFKPCMVDPFLPETSVDLIRRCEPDIIRTCARNWTNTEVLLRCEAYTAHVFRGGDGYRNPHCAICNNVQVQLLQCSKTNFRSMFPKDFNPAAFSWLFDIKPDGGNAVGFVQACPRETQLYDPFFKRCRDMICTLEQQDFSDGNCVTIDIDLNDGFGEMPEINGTHYSVDNETRNILTDDDLNNTIAEFIKCPKFTLSPSEFIFKEDNVTVYVPTYKRSFEQGHFYVNEEGHLEICAHSVGTRYVDKFDVNMGYVTFAGLGVSIVFLILHLIAFSLIPDLRNLSGKNLASLCVALLCGYLSFIIGQGVGVAKTVTCAATAVITYYGFLASFMWMLVMAFDVWRTLRLATSELRVTGGKQWRKFLCYSAACWITPLLFVVAAVATDSAEPGAVEDAYRPGFAMHSCWFGRRAALLVFFAAPLAVVMACNVCFFASSAHMIFSATSTARFTATSGARRDFRLYARLALVMGLTWCVGLVAGYLDTEGLWYAFIALNTLQGLFIFLAFTCTEKVVRALATLMGRNPDDTHLGCKPNPPSLSWASDATRKSNLGSGSDHRPDALY